MLDRALTTQDLSLSQSHRCLVCFVGGVGCGGVAPPADVGCRVEFIEKLSGWVPFFIKPIIMRLVVITRTVDLDLCVHIARCRPLTLPLPAAELCLVVAWKFSAHPTSTGYHRTTSGLAGYFHTHWRGDNASCVCLWRVLIKTSLGFPPSSRRWEYSLHIMSCNFSLHDYLLHACA